GPPDLLGREMLGRIELGGCAFAVFDPRGSRAPPVIQGPGADAEWRDGAHSGDDYLTLHPARLTTRSIASPTVLMLFMSPPLSWTPYSSSTIWEISARSSESTSSSSNVASREISDGSTSNCSMASLSVFSTASGVTVVV